MAQTPTYIIRIYDPDIKSIIKALASESSFVFFLKMAETLAIKFQERHLTGDLDYRCEPISKRYAS